MIRERFAWPILLLLLTVLVPSAGVMWMMREAVKNEQIATRQRLQESYALQLDHACQSVRQQWEQQLNELTAELDTAHPRRVFEESLAGGMDSCVILGEGRNILYPDSAESLPDTRAALTDPRWEQAQHLEFREQKFKQAADLYGALGEESEETVEQARAKQSLVRCLQSDGQTDEAIKQLQQLAAFENVFDSQGRSFAAMAQLRILELTNQESVVWRETFQSLQLRLEDYTQNLPSAQRLFLMKQLQPYDSKIAQWKTLEAETLANRIEAKNLKPGLSPTGVEGLWAWMSEKRPLVPLYKTNTIKQRLLELAAKTTLPKGIAFAVSSPGAPQTTSLIDQSLGPELGDWRLGLASTEGDPFTAKSQYRQTVHAWIAALVIASTCVLAWLLMSNLRRRMELAQLKNDLAATVSHELKTPLASIRLLVDNLLEDEERFDRSQTREYLQLISHENKRLSRLIDNFLTFSRMERKQMQFQFAPVEVDPLIEEAATVFLEHGGKIPVSLEIENDDGTVLVSADRDALVTVLVNLLENAFKYGSSKDTDKTRIELRTRVENGYVSIAVRDWGKGIAPRYQNRIFEQFYQVDQSVAREHGGCGLGLSIVKSIVEAHEGTVEVDSQLGSGSTLTIRLPVIDRP